MAKKLLAVEVKGNNSRWVFHFYGDPKYLPDWHADGLNVEQIENTIPMWIVDMGMIRQWVFMQDLFNFKNPFASKEGKRQSIEVPHEDAE